MIDQNRDQREQRSQRRFEVSERLETIHMEYSITGSLNRRVARFHVITQHCQTLFFNDRAIVGDVMETRPVVGFN